LGHEVYVGMPEVELNPWAAYPKVGGDLRLSKVRSRQAELQHHGCEERFFDGASWVVKIFPRGRW
jgi:hypothetical protein